MVFSHKHGRSSALRTKWKTKLAPFEQVTSTDEQRSVPGVGDASLELWNSSWSSPQSWSRKLQKAKQNFRKSSYQTNRRQLGEAICLRMSKLSLCSSKKDPRTEADNKGAYVKTGHVSQDITSYHKLPYAITSYSFAVGLKLCDGQSSKAADASSSQELLVFADFGAGCYHIWELSTQFASTCRSLFFTSLSISTSKRPGLSFEW